ncbi:MAG: exodeoxyribonuclease VII large subunit [Anaerolineae bacterium]|nr:exodeoxyribonuclease VII large subunit [Anaerolineae bacterium]
MADTYTVYELTIYIRDLFDLDPRLQDVWIEGEISNFKRAASGHLYFTLKDDQSELPCVMWRWQAEQLVMDPRHGDAVLAHGRIAVYEARGQYQLYCDLIQPAGVGELNRQFELLKARLDAEGLFDADRKRPVPAYPRQIGIVTSPTTAAFQDIQNVIWRRYPVVELILSPTLVQGQDAPPQIVAAIERLNAFSEVDVIVVARGGGSLEDLWCFNDESVVRAVAASRIPVVTGVGHEIDFTLVDFAADQRAPTPSAAAELVTPDGDALRLAVRERHNALRLAADAFFAGQRQAIEHNRQNLRRVSPLTRLHSARQRLDELSGRSSLLAQHSFDRRRDRLQAVAQALNAANPASLLQRGYAIVTRESDGHRLASVQDAAEGTWLQIALHDGRLKATVRAREGTRERESTGDDG